MRVLVSGFLLALIVGSPTAARARTTLFEAEAPRVEREVGGTRFSPDSRLLVVMGNPTQLYEVPSFKIVLTLDFKKTSGQAAFSPDGKFLALAGSHDVEVFALPAGGRVGKADFSGHGPTGFPISGLAFSSDGKSLMAVTGGRYFVFTVAGGVKPVFDKELHARPYDGTGVAFSPNGRHVALTLPGDKVQLLELDDPKAPRLIKETIIAGASRMTNSASSKLSSNAALLALASDPRGIVVSSPLEGRELHAWGYGGCMSACFDISPSGKRIALRSRGGTRIFDGQTGSELAFVKEYADSPRLSFSPDDRFVAGTEAIRKGGKDGRDYAVVWVEEWNKLAKNESPGPALWGKGVPVAVEPPRTERQPPSPPAEPSSAKATTTAATKQDVNPRANLNAEVVPLGFALRRVSFATVAAKVKGLARGKGQVKVRQRDPQTKGAVINVMGNPFGIDGLNETALLFDEKGILSAVEMYMDKGRFAEVVSYLKGKYALEKLDDPFVGDRSAEFTAIDPHGAGTFRIAASAPHLGDSLTVSYWDVMFLGGRLRNVVEREIQRQTTEKQKF